jgi:hypothetical protein
MRLASHGLGTPSRPRFRCRDLTPASRLLDAGIAATTGGLIVDVAGAEIAIQHLQRAAPGLPLAAQEGLDASRSPSRVTLLIACGAQLRPSAWNAGPGEGAYEGSLSSRFPLTPLTA